MDIALPMRHIVTAVVKIAAGRQECIYLDDLSAPFARTTTREFVRLCFAEVGIEIEFSGKNMYEKGVIIDTDEELLLELGLATDGTKFGQTVVRVNTQAGESLLLREEELQPGEDTELAIKHMLAAELRAVKKDSSTHN
jgi:GDPmannose 4,6-dehydratase